MCLQGPSDSWAGQSLLEADPSCKGKGDLLHSVWRGSLNWLLSAYQFNWKQELELLFFLQFDQKQRILIGHNTCRLSRVRATSSKSLMGRSLPTTYLNSLKAEIKQRYTWTPQSQAKINWDIIMHLMMGLLPELINRILVDDELDCWQNEEPHNTVRAFFWQRW